MLTIHILDLMMRNLSLSFRKQVVMHTDRNLSTTITVGISNSDHLLGSKNYCRSQLQLQVGCQVSWQEKSFQFREFLFVFQHHSKLMKGHLPIF